MPQPGSTVHLKPVRGSEDIVLDVTHTERNELAANADSDTNEEDT